MSRILFLMLILGIKTNLMSQCVTYCNTNVGVYSNNDASSIAYGNMSSSFHSSFVSEKPGFRVWGERMANNGVSHLLSPQFINSTNYPALTGSIYYVGLGSKSIDSVQLIVLTSTGLFASGTAGSVLSPTIKATATFQKLTINGKTDGLPTGITPDSVKMMFVTHRTIIITTCGGRVFVLSQDVNVRGGLGAGSSTTWSQVMQSAGIPLTNVIVTRGNGRFGYALKSDNTLWTWGDNVLVGNGTATQSTNYALQMTVPAGVTGIKMIQATRNIYTSSSGISYYFLGTNQRVYALGANNNGQLGDNTSVNKSVWVNCLYPNNSIITNAKWISSNEHDPIYPNLSIINSNAQVFNCGNNNNLMIGRTVNSGINYLNYPVGIVSTDTILFDEVGGHTSAYIKINTPRYGYVGHHINGSIGNGSSVNSTLNSVNFIIPPIVNICGTNCDTPVLYKKPYNCNDTQAFFVIKSSAGNKVRYTLNNSSVDSVIIGLSDSVIITINNPTTDQILRIIQIDNILCDLVLNVTDTIKRTYNTSLSATICSNQTYLFNGINRTASGTYLDTLLSSNGCDSFLTLNLTVNPTKTGTINATICSNQSYLFNGFNRTTSGTYLDTLLSSNGCDSFLTLNLTVNPTKTGTINATICSNQSYLFNGINRTASGTYLDTLLSSNGCDSFLTLNLTVNPTKTGTLNATICSNQTYLFNGFNRTTTGTYLDTLVASNGCDSFLTLNLTVNLTKSGSINATICSNQTYLFNGFNRTTTGTYLDTLVANNGCDSFLTLNLTVNPTKTGTINATICSNQTYLFNGIIRTTSGTYLDTLVASNGCDSFLTLNLSVNPTKTGSINATICSNQTYLFNGINRTTSGTYLDTLVASNGCDSFLTLNLTVNPTKTGTINVTICSNQTYLFNGINRTTSGTYLDTLVASNGCDSFLTLNLTVNPTKSGTINAAICFNQSYLFNGINRSTSGTYLDTLVSSNGCDSFLTLNLTVNPTKTGTINATICSNQSYLFNGINRTTSGTYQDTLVASNGCDSFLTLILTVNPTKTGTINATICSNQSYLFNGINQTTSGTYLDTLVSSNGCDSFLTLNLIVNPTKTGSINATICSNQSYLFNGINRTTSGTYLDTLVASNGCDSFLTLNLMVNSTKTGSINATICSNQSYLFNGINRMTTGTYLDTLVANNGCDSFLTLNLTVNPTKTGTINATICSNQTYLFKGINRTTSGTYLDTLVSSIGCDSFLTLNLTVNPTKTGTINATICSNQTYLFNGINITASGTYLDTLVASNGCDSFLTLNLMVNPTKTGTINATICSNQSYLFNGINQTTSGTYLDTLLSSNGCDSFLTLNLTVNPTKSGSINATICSNQTYLFNGINRTNSGTYLDTLVASNGCDSFLTLNLTVNPIKTKVLNISICPNQTYLFNGVNRNNSGTYLDTLVASNGCDSFLTLNLTVNPTKSGSINATICSNQSYLFNGINRTTTGTYFDTLVSSNGCDSFLTLNLTVNPTKTGSINATICSNQSYLFNGINRTTSGTYLDTLVSSNGCDSFLTLNLTVNPTKTGSINATICSNQTYLFNGNNRTNSGTYLDTLVASNGCDSFLTLNLTVNPIKTKVLNISICPNQTYLFNGVNRNTSGTYLDTLVASNGCDSFLTLNLTVIPIKTGTINATICSNQTYLFNGINRTTSGTYLDTLVASNGCDSFLTLNLIVNPTKTGTINATICSNQTYLFNGINRTTTGTYLDTLVANNGCDSFLTLNLTVNPTKTGSINATICSNQTYLFNGINRKLTGTYLDTLVASNGCDSFLSLNLTVFPTKAGIINATICSNQNYLFNGINRNSSGTYLDTLVASNGCDSFLTLNLTVNPIKAKILNINICPNQSYLFNGINQTTTGTYLDTLAASNGCDSFITLNLTVNPTKTGTINVTICSNQSYLFNGINRTTTGTYLDTLVSSNGCDSFLTLNLRVNPTNTGSINATICSNQTYLFNGINRTTTGTYLDTLISSNGCDSFLTLNLTVKPTKTGTINATICSNQTYLFNGINRTTTGVYMDTLVSTNGCDSFLSLHLTVNPISNTILHKNICNGQVYYFNGQNLSSSGTYLDTLVSNNGCDSFVNLFLNVIVPIHKILDTSACDFMVYKNITIDKSTTVYDTLHSVEGCDSVLLKVQIVIFKMKINKQDTMIHCKVVTYEQENYYRDTILDIIIKKTVFPYCDSILKRIQIIVLPAPNATLTATPSNIVKYGETITLSAAGGIHYMWNLNNDTNQTIQFNVLEKKYVEVTVTDENTCDSVIGLWVYVEQEIDFSEIFAPIDGPNSYFKPHIKGDVEIQLFKIYNRWGQLLYESHDKDPSWDGTFKGNEQPQGTYVYYVEYILNGTLIHKVGGVTLIR